MQQASPIHKDSGLYRLIVETRRLFNALAQASSQLSQDTGVTASMRAVLEELYPATAMTVPEIARNKQVTRQHIQQIVNQLLDGQLVESVDNPAHKRSSLIRLTSRGRETFQAIAALEVQLLESLEEEFASLPLDKAVATLKAIREYFSSEVWHAKLAELQGRHPE